MNNGLVFNPETHEYFWNGVKRISVTQYLKLAGFIDSRWYTDKGRQRGQAVHLACSYLNENDLDWNSVDEPYKPYVDGYRLFMSDTNFVPQLVEHRVYDEIWGVAGTLDATGTWKLTSGNILIDIKTGQVQPWAAIQTSAYEACLGASHRRYALELRDNGTYRLHEYKDRNDIKVFKCIVTQTNWAIQQGIITV